MRRSSWAAVPVMQATGGAVRKGESSGAESETSRGTRMPRTGEDLHAGDEVGRFVDDERRRRRHAEQAAEAAETRRWCPPSPAGCSRRDAVSKCARNTASLKPGWGRRRSSASRTIAGVRAGRDAGWPRPTRALVRPDSGDAHPTRDPKSAKAGWAGWRTIRAPAASRRSTSYASAAVCRRRGDAPGVRAQLGERLRRVMTVWPASVSDVVEFECSRRTSVVMPFIGQERGGARVSTGRRVD